MMQRIVLVIVAVAAVVGWVVAFLNISGSSDLKDRLAATKAELSEVSEQLTKTQSRLALTQGAAGSFGDIDERMAAKQAEAAALAEEIEAKRSELGTLRQDLEVAKAELGRLRTGSERQRGALMSSPAETQTSVQPSKAPTAPVTAPATIEATTAEAIPAANPLADARRRFARIDQDGDGRFDRLDFRLKRVSLFGLVDANEDGYLALDETLLSPEAFQNFDTNEDGKISSLDNLDRRSFSMMDTDRDEFVTFEEYVKILRVSPE
jgi:hypothetical protein